MRRSDEETVGLTSRDLYIDDAPSQSSSQFSASEPLLEEESRSTNPTLHKPKWRAFLSSQNPRRSRRKPSRPGNDIGEKPTLNKQKRSRLCLNISLGILVLLGVIQLLNLIGSLVVLILPDSIHRIVDSWGRPGHIGAGLSSWPTDFSRDIIPMPCHSHNDYWRRVPLFSAIEVGCIGVEADIWLFDEELFVGHSVASLTPNRTLDSLYINPLLDVLSKQNPRLTILPDDTSQPHGVFDTDPEQTLILLIDFKTSGSALWPHVQSALQPLREKNYLTRSNGTQITRGPITVVGTGNTPFDMVNSEETNPHHDVFFDAPLSEMYGGTTSGDLSTATSINEEPPKDTMQGEPLSDENEKLADTTKVSLENARKRRSDEEGQGKSRTISGDANAYTTSNSYYASVSFGDAIGQLWDGQFSDHQMDLLRGQIKGAHRRGLKARYWDLPFWPISLRNHVWDVLVKEGVDLLNVDDLKGATRRNWNRHHGWWKRMKGVSNDVHGGIEDSVDSPAVLRL
ncbi:hypothetical protein HO133_001193 [Letharia lupina]|uniref:Altered inheritance of mitochondria protein 6 n=1 Tax=Letharia lupina TaxID=560253 RepID=A0A8H6CEP4_9LECA|nr:uncharacterized protein HO133_001193 [Letharia lupina]KAF6222107.1 hypothetical protein HO133_001193 [Letharia lupina]